MNKTPEQLARDAIDDRLAASGWAIQKYHGMDFAAAAGLAVTEYPTSIGPADYALFADRKAVGIVEARWGDDVVDCWAATNTLTGKAGLTFEDCPNGCHHVPCDPQATLIFGRAFLTATQWLPRLEHHRQQDARSAGVDFRKQARIPTIKWQLRSSFPPLKTTSRHKASTPLRSRDISTWKMRWEPGIEQPCDDGSMFSYWRDDALNLRGC